LAEPTPLHFDRYGRTYQLRIRDARDLESVLDLDSALWIATSAPTSSLNCDREFLAFVDSDGNGRVCCDEVRAAIRWLLKRLSDTSRIGEGTDDVPLAAINDERAEGKALVATARYIIQALNSEPNDRIELARVAGFVQNLDQHPVNGDGVVPPEATDDEDVRRFIEDVLTCVDGSEDRTGRRGLTEDDLGRFMAETAAYVGWVGRADSESGEAAAVMPLGAETPAAYAAFRAVRDKVEDFFTRCDAVQFLGSAYDLAEASPTPGEGERTHGIAATLRLAPLARPNEEGILDLAASVNPAYESEAAALGERAVKPVLGAKTAITRGDWERVTQYFAAHQAWAESQAGASVAHLGVEKLRAYLAGGEAGAVRELLAEDKSVAVEAARARELQKLLLYHRHLLPLVNNFVSFPDLYDLGRRAMFEMGSLVIDGRWLNFAVRVDDLAAHRQTAAGSGMYVVYAELRRADMTTPLSVASVATAGVVGNLAVGKRGVFVDTSGRHYSARVVEIIENPISYQEAVFAPFVRLGRFVAGKIEAISGSAQKELEGRLARVSQGVEAGVQETIREAPQLAAGAPQPAAVAPARDQQAAASRRDLLVGASVSIAALTSAFAFITNQLSGVTGAQILLALAVLVGVVLVPTALVAAVRLSRRDLSAILEGCGWAINARMRLDRRQRRQFTRHPAYPEGATGTPRRHVAVLVAAVLVALVVLVLVRAAVR
jgi:hypothetical protein